MIVKFKSMILKVASSFPLNFESLQAVFMMVRNRNKEKYIITSYDTQFSIKFILGEFKMEEESLASDPVIFRQIDK